MSAVICIVLISWFVSALIRSSEAKKQAKRMAKIKAEQTRQKEEIRQQREEAREWARQQVEMQREQIRLAKEQERQAREIEKHEAWLVKHDAEISALQFKVGKAESDIAHWKEQIGNLYALLDIAQAEMESALVGGKIQTKYQKQVISLNNQIHTAEQRLNKAQFDKDCAERKLKEVA